MSRLPALYPRAWRDRYGAELDALLEDHPPSLGDRLDLIRGAFDAHRHPELVADVSSNVRDADDGIVTRRLGVAGLAGAAAWAVAWLVMSTAPLVDDGTVAYRDGAAAMPILLLAGALLVAGLCGQLISLRRTARLARIGALIAIPGIVLWSLVPWNGWLAVTALAGLGLLAVGAWFARAWPWTAAVALLLMVAALPVIAVSGMAEGPVGAHITPTLALFIVVPLVAWLTVGGTLLLRQPVTERV